MCECKWGVFFGFDILEGEWEVDFCEGLFFIKVLSEKLKVPTEILKRAKK